MNDDVVPVFILIFKQGQGSKGFGTALEGGAGFRGRAPAGCLPVTTGFGPEDSFCKEAQDARSKATKIKKAVRIVFSLIESFWTTDAILCTVYLRLR